jgi:hypothetical protein
MGVPASEVGYTSATTGRGDHEVHKGHVVAMGEKNILFLSTVFLYHLIHFLSFITPNFIIFLLMF